MENLIKIFSKKYSQQTQLSKYKNPEDVQTLIYAILLVQIEESNVSLENFKEQLKYAFEDSRISEENIAYLYKNVRKNV